MGDKGGRPRKPTALKVLHGDRSDRRPDGEPVPGAGAIEPPQWLGDQALEVWDSLAGDLKRVGVLTSWDTEAFASLCDAVIQRRRAQAEIDRGGAVIEVPVYRKDGEMSGFRTVRSPWWLVYKEADEIFRRYCARFGLTPADRAALSVAREGKRDADDDLLTGS